jgi:signal transduction histidine kinase
MQTKRRWSERTRLMLTLEFAVVLPAATLVILSAWHLKSIQRGREIEAAIQRDFSEVLAIAEKHINHKAYALVDDVRDELPLPGETCSVVLDKVLASHPYAAHVFVYNPKNGLVLRSQPSRLREPDFRAESDAAFKMIEPWMKSEFDQFADELEKMEEKGTPYICESNWPLRGDRRVYQSMAFFAKADRRTGSKAISGMIFDAEYLRSQFLPETLESVMSHTSGEGQNDASHAVIMIHPKSDAEPLATSAGWDGGEPELEQRMEGAFPGLVMAIKLPGTTLQAIGQRFVRTGFMILGGISLLLAAGIVLTHRNISREMALARLKSDFVSNVSHELRTPLSLIRLYAETLEMGRLKTPEKCHEYYRIIRKESERLTALINNILDFSRIEAGRREYDFRETDLRELVRNTMDSYRYQIEQHGFVFEEKIDENVPLLRVDREAMARSLLNLVNNALKYSQERKYLGVHLYRTNGSVKLEVIDHGIGIPAQEQHKIFEKFYRVGDPLVHNTKGSGLGLALVRHIAQAHGGEVSVDSNPGEGSKFTILLPVSGREGKADVTQTA